MLTRMLIFVLGLMLWAAPPALAQQATLEGTVLDDTGAVLPGVTVTATDLETGRETFAVTDGQGQYRLANLPAATYRVQAELPGFATVVMPRVELLVGQNAALGFTLQVATLEETITVTGETPLVDTRGTQVSGNVDRRQMEELPIQGRNWMELAKMVRGITSNDVGNRPGVERDEQFQLNLDGQQVTQQVASSGFGQPKFSREAIAEFQIVTQMFDITQGRSSGIQVQAITRGGTNTLSGSAYGYFRDDRFNAPDNVAGVVLPFQNQQVGGTVGGPIVRDKMHYFVSYEYEREPSTIFANPAQLPNQNWTFTKTVPQNSLMGRTDWSLSDRDRLTIRASYWDWEDPWFMSGAQHPSQSALRTRESYNTLGTWSRVINDRLVGELKVGYNHFEWQNLLNQPGLASQPNLVFPGLTLGQPRNYPQQFFQNQVSARYDLSWHRDRHDYKIGSEVIYWKDTGQWQLLSRGEFIFSARPNDLERRFPAGSYDNPAAWDLTGLDPLIQRFDQNFGDWTIDIPRPTWAMWFGDTWRMNDRFTMNYGIRWDVDYGALNPPHVNATATFDPAGGVPPFPDGVAINPGDRLFRTGMRDLNNFAPRVGFNYKATDTGDLVIRGGTGLYFGVTYSNITFSQQSFNGDRILVNSFPNDGLPGFIFDPLRGVTQEDIRAGRVPMPAQAPRVIAHDFEMPYTWQSSIGFQKQLSPIMGLEMDVTYWKQRNDPRERDLNLFFNPANGYNLDPAVGGRPDPKWGQISWLESTGTLDYLAVSSGLTRRLSNNFQGGITYTVMAFKNDDTTAGFQQFANNQFNFDDEWSRSTDFQRQTLRLNGLYRLPWDFAVAGTYSFGSGNYYTTTITGRPFNKPGTNRLNTGAPVAVRAEALDRFDGPPVIGTNEVAPRNALRGHALHKVDVRVTKDVRLGGSVRLSGIAEVFNLFNHDNFGAYNGQINSATFGNPNQNLGTAYVPRSGQFGVRLTF